VGVQQKKRGGKGRRSFSAHEKGRKKASKAREKNERKDIAMAATNTK
jgi:hypothetical protein